MSELVMAFAEFGAAFSYQGYLFVLYETHFLFGHYVPPPKVRGDILVSLA